MRAPDKKWTPEENERLLALYETTPGKELEGIFGRSEKAIAAHAYGMGLKKPVRTHKPHKPGRPLTAVSREPNFIIRGQRGPAYLPGEPDTSKAKFTYGPSPAQPTRTNTHSDS